MDCYQQDMIEHEMQKTYCASNVTIKYICLFIVFFSELMVLRVFFISLWQVLLRLKSKHYLP